MFRVAFLTALGLLVARVAGRSPGMICGTEMMKEASDEVIREVLRRYRQDGARRLSLTVPMCLHVLYPVGGENGAQNVDNTILQAQLDHLNKAFSGSSCCDTSATWCVEGTCSVDTGITFAIAELVDGSVTGNTVASVTATNACVTRTANDAWAVLEDEDAMHIALAQGGPETLNAYVMDTDARALGLATWSAIFNHYGTLPGVDSEHASAMKTEGDVFVHEVRLESAASVLSSDLLKLSISQAAPNFSTISTQTGHWLGTCEAVTPPFGLVTRI